MDDTPKWIPVLFGSVILIMGGIILGALFGFIPTDEGGRFAAPHLVIVSLGLSLVLGEFLRWVPSRTPPLLRTFLALIVLALIAVVCSWTAFAPDVVYGPEAGMYIDMPSSEFNITARIVFGVVALIIDSVFISTLIRWARKVSEGDRDH